MKEDADWTVVERCRGGDRRACEQLVLRYQKPVYNAALRLLRNPEDARDVAQTAFLKAFEHLADYDPRFKFYSWIYRIAINAAVAASRCPFFRMQPPGQQATRIRAQLHLAPIGSAGYRVMRLLILS